MHGFLSHRSGLCFFLLLVLICPLDAAAADYHFDSRHGDDGNTGTLSSPWKSLRKANSLRLSPGDGLYLKRGEVWQGMLTVSSSGEKQRPITIGAYGEGPAPVIDSTRAVKGQWMSLGKNRYAHMWPQQPHVLFFNDEPRPPIFSIRLSPGQEQLPQPGAILLQIQKGTPYTNFSVLSADSKTKTLHGITDQAKHWDTSRKVQVRQISEKTGKEELWPFMSPPAAVGPDLSGLTENGRWYWQNSMVYLASDKHPDEISIRVGSLDYGIDTNRKKHLILKDLKIIGANVAGVFVNGSREVLVENMTIHGIGRKSHKSGIILIDSSDNRIQRNTIEGVLSVGIALYAFSDVTHRNVISENHVSGSGSIGIIVGGEEPFRVADNLVQGNKVFRSNQLAYDSAGIYAYFCGKGNVIRDNVIREGGTRFLKSCGIMADTDSGPLTITGNTIENNSFAGIAVTESGHIITDNHLADNSSPQWEGAELVFFPVNDPAADCEVRNNTLKTEADFVRIEKGSDRGHVFDRNQYQGGGPNPFHWNNSPLTFGLWQKRTGFDRESEYKPVRQ